MRRARRSLTFLLIIIVGLVGLITFGVLRSDATWTPKLALDLQGGTQILLAPQQTDGQAVSGEQLSQAVEIIRQRVDSSGVSEAEITTQGSQNISVSIPGKADEATLERIAASAKLDFRTVLAADVATGSPQDPAVEGDAATEEGASEGDAAAESAAEEGAGDETAATEEGADGEAAEETAEEDLGPIDPDPIPDTPYDQAWMTPALMQEFADFSCDSESVLDAGEAPTDRPLITCDNQGMWKYILGPVELGGEVITDAVAQPATTSTGATTGGWAVQMTLDNAGTETFGQISTRLYGAEPPTDQFAFVLDGQVLSAPQMQGQILDGRPSISGDFTQESAEVLADQLKFGALPIGFEMQSQVDISATLGSNQLQAGLLAGLIGLLLVVVYSMFQYRVLSVVTITSLAIAALLTYLLLTYFSWRQGYRLSLAGVAGIIVAVGFTADSFILYFERIRDSIRDGFGIEKAVDLGWKQAIRTILASDAIFIMASVILFIFAVANVRGFAFTLGLTTVIDVLVVTLFTHPVMTLLSRTKFYRNGHPASGLDPRGLGATYRGRLEFRAPVVAGSGKGRKNKGAQREAERRQTIAERKAAQEMNADASTGKEG
ncbi:MAG: protein translocase subunit SecD [Leucobacter sp.]